MKNYLFASLLAQLLSDHEHHIKCSVKKESEDRLTGLVAQFVFNEDDDGYENPPIALFGIRLYGLFNGWIGAQLNRSNQISKDVGEYILKAGIEKGPFKYICSKQTAIRLITAINYIQIQQITIDEENDTCTRTVIEEILSQILDPILKLDVSLLPLNQTPTAFDRQD